MAIQYHSEKALELAIEKAVAKSIDGIPTDKVFNTVADFPTPSLSNVGSFRTVEGGDYWNNGSVIKKESGVLASAKLNDRISIRATDNVLRQSPFDLGSVYVSGGLL
jgi:hypothetical protein